MMLRFLLMAATGIISLFLGTHGDIRADDAGQQLHRLFDREWQRTLKENPAFASRLGDRRYQGTWSDVSLSAIEQSNRETKKALLELRTIDVNQLSAADKLNYRLFQQQYETSVAEQKYRLFLLPLTQRGGIQDENNLADALSFDSLQDYEGWIDRIEAFPTYMTQTMELMKQGMQEGMLHPKVVMKRVPAQIRKQLVQRPQESLYYKPFRTLKIEVTDEQRAALQQKAADAIERCILPSYQRFLEFFETEYLPASFAEVGCWQRPDGQNMYATLARKFTTTTLTPQQIHDIGLREITGIREEMEAIQKQVKFDGSFQEFLSFLRTDKQFYFKNPNDLLEAYRECCRRIDPQLSTLFKRMPKTPYEILPIPAQMAPDTTTAYYRQPSADGSRPGAYFVNLYRPDVRPKYEIEALSLHESVPGHHFQIALAMEQGSTPEFRRYGGYTAFIEGWGLYSEKLGEELGMYKDPYSKFGQLTYEMWRAVRLVVDTGMHSRKWTRQQAIDLFAQNTAKSLLDIENEIDRYIAWPGQALAYKIGELKIRELRSIASQQLGDDFDVRDFHEVVLQNGAVPLGILEEQIHAWLNERR